MRFDFDNWFDPNDISHVYSGIAACSTTAFLAAKFSPLFAIGGAILLIHILHRELWLERHQTSKKTIKDIITKLVGLSIFVFFVPLSWIIDNIMSTYNFIIGNGAILVEKTINLIPFLQ